MKYWRTIYAEIKLNIVETLSYKFDFIGEIVILTTLYFMIIFLNAPLNMISYYGVSEGDSVSLVLVGYIYWTFSTHIIETISNEIQKEAAKGTLEQKFMSVVPYWYLTIGDFVATLLLHSVVVVVLSLVSKILLGTALGINIWFFVILFVCLIGMFGIALIIGSLALVGKKVSNLVLIMQFVLLVASNTLTKFEGLPINKILPLTNAIDIIRAIMSETSIQQLDINLLLVTSLVWFIGGMLLFTGVVRYVKKEGSLAQY